MFRISLTAVCVVLLPGLVAPQMAAAQTSLRHKYFVQAGFAMPMSGADREVFGSEWTMLRVGALALRDGVPEGRIYFDYVRGEDDPGSITLLGFGFTKIVTAQANTRPYLGWGLGMWGIDPDLKTEIVGGEKGFYLHSVAGMSLSKQLTAELSYTSVFSDWDFSMLSLSVAARF
ncbi:MAG: hypothetical protein NTU88_13975 [Armatimonadetes bacterium]|nr:hypothetical protein [Armatimonadota bacterium]